MKPLKTRTFLVLHILTALSVMAAVIGFTFCSKLVTFWPAVWGFVNHGDVQFPIILGVAPLSLLCYFASFIFTYLIFEFYGFKQGFYNTLGIIGSLAACFGVFWLLKNYGIGHSNPDYEDMLASSFLVQGRRFTAASLVAIFSGFTTCLVIAAAIKKLMRNYFMFIRYPIAGIIGWTLFVLTHTYISYFGIMAPESMIFYAVTPLAQYIILVLVSIFFGPLYLLRLFFGLFRGWDAKDSETPDATGRKSFFKAPAQEALPAKEEQEDTVSERIKLTQILAKN